MPPLSSPVLLISSHLVDVHLVAVYLMGVHLVGVYLTGVAPHKRASHGHAPRRRTLSESEKGFGGTLRIPHLTNGGGFVEI